MNAQAPHLSRREMWTAALVLFGAAFLLFANTFGHGWTYDDIPVIVENPDVRSWTEFLRDSYPGRPLRELTFLIDHALFGMDPAGWRVQNILWHGLNALLLYVLVRRLGGGEPAAAIASALFLVHPVQVEVVANISHRKDSLTLFFLLLACHSWLKALASDRRLPWLAAACCAWGLALAGKENAIVLPAVLLVCEWIGPHSTPILLRRRTAVAVFAGIAVIAVWKLQQGGVTDLSGAARDLLLKNQMVGGIGDCYRAVLAAWSFQAGHLFLPRGLAIEYLVPVPSTWTSPRIILPLFAACISIPVMILLRRCSPLACFGLAWFAVFWLPTGNLWPSAYLAADRYLYTPAAGIFILTAVALSSLPLPVRKPAAALSVICVIVLVVLTWKQNQTWASEESLLQQALAVSPRSAFVLNELGKLREQDDRVVEAVDFFRRATIADPRSAASHYNLAKLYEGAGLLPLAAEHYGIFLRLDRPAYRTAAAELTERLKRQYGWSLQ